MHIDAHTMEVPLSLCMLDGLRESDIVLNPIHLSPEDVLMLTSQDEVLKKIVSEIAQLGGKLDFESAMGEILVSDLGATTILILPVHDAYGHKIVIIARRLDVDRVVAYEFCGIEEDKAVYRVHVPGNKGVETLTLKVNYRDLYKCDRSPQSLFCWITPIYLLMAAMSTAMPDFCVSEKESLDWTN